jgi:hypothetical protein
MKESWKVVLTSASLPHPKTESHFSLPFVPFIGLTVDVGGVDLTISYIKWNRKDELFEVVAVKQEGGF